MSRRQKAYTVRSFALLAFFDLMLRLGGVRRAIACARLLARQGTRRDGDPEQMAQAVAATASLYPRRALCLEQSLVLLVLLRRAGHAAELRFGVRPYPFHAHAWIEVDGAPLNEQRDAIRQLARFEAVGGR